MKQHTHLNKWKIAIWIFTLFLYEIENLSLDLLELYKNLKELHSQKMLLYKMA